MNNTALNLKESYQAQYRNGFERGFQAGIDKFDLLVQVFVATYVLEIIFYSPLFSYLDNQLEKVDLQYSCIEGLRTGRVFIAIFFAIGLLGFPDFLYLG